MGFEADEFINNSTISMYTKCGIVMDAQQVFDRLFQPGVIFLISPDCSIHSAGARRSSDIAILSYASQRCDGTCTDICQPSPSLLHICIEGGRCIGTIAGGKVGVFFVERGQQGGGWCGGLENGCARLVFGLVWLQGKGGCV